jgi:hypothetical protein
MALSLLWNSFIQLLPASTGFFLTYPLAQKMEVVCSFEPQGVAKNIIIILKKVSLKEKEIYFIVRHL